MSHQVFALIVAGMILPILVVVAAVEWWRDRPEARLAKALEEFHAHREGDRESGHVRKAQR